MTKKILSIFSIILVVFSVSMTPPARASLPAIDSQGRSIPTLAPMLKQVTPAVVNIATEGRIRVQDNPLLQDPFFRFFFNIPEQAPRERRTQSLGSGVIVDAQKGYIMTNNHVIDKAVSITVTLQNDKQLSAKLVGTDPESDIAVIQVSPEDLPTAITLADSDKLQVGDFVVAIGSPFGLGQTVTSGIVSALGRRGLGIEGYEDFIQTDASINPGNSGGALVNLRGELVGINTAILAPSGGNIGIGFAIPINMAKQIMSQLVEYGEVKRGHLGIAVQDLTPDLAKAFGIQQQEGGAVVVQVVENTASDKAGIEIGDVITKVNDKPVRDAGDLRNVIGLLRVDQKVKLSILHNGKERTTTLAITEPQQTTIIGEKLSEKLAGATFSAINEGSPMFNQSEGIFVVNIDAGSPAARAGLRKGDVIVSVNRAPVNDLESFKEALKLSSRGILLNVRRGDTALFIIIQ
jgi:Do/DeqQ family serine protease